MAKTKTITVTLTRRVSDGNYGTYGGEITETVELEEGDNRKKVLSKLQDRLADDLTEVIALTKPKEKK